MNSIGGRSIEGPSPLAQIYQPLVVQENEETEPISTGTSYGRPNRRQVFPMLSMHRRNHLDAQGHEPQPRRTTRSRSPALYGDWSPGSFRNQSLDDLSGQRPPREEHDIAQEPEAEEEGRAALTGRWLARLDSIEERQIRMEDILAQIVNELKTR